MDKYYQFVGSHKSSGLFELDATTLKKNPNYLYLSNKSGSRMKGELSFTIGKENLTNTIIVKKTHSVAINIPINSKNIKLALFTLTLIEEWKIIDTLNLNELPIEKCYEVTSKLFNTLFSIKELDCSSIKRT